MLYVPLFFYLFDRLKERGEKPAAVAGERPADAQPAKAD